jgi:hypothetical protein
MEEVGFTAGHPAACEFDVNSIESQRIWECNTSRNKIHENPIPFHKNTQHTKNGT